MNFPAPATLPATFLSEPQYKERFAQSLFEGYQPLIAAMKIWPDNQIAYQYSERWKNDPYVLNHIEKLKDAAAKSRRTPTKEDLIHDMRERCVQIQDHDTYIKAMRLMAEMIGAIEKPQTQVNVQNNQVNNPVMVVRDHGSDDDWRAKLKAQQAKLKTINHK